MVSNKNKSSKKLIKGAPARGLFSDSEPANIMLNKSSVDLTPSEIKVKSKFANGTAKPPRSMQPSPNEDYQDSL